MTDSYPVDDLPVDDLEKIHDPDVDPFEQFAGLSPKQQALRAATRSKFRDQQRTEAAESAKKFWGDK